jgi:very-short-patch-repair endonuclease
MRGPDRKMIRIARKLRGNQTDVETVLWNRIRNRQIDGHKFVRQEPIGGYICDFVCRDKLLIIEVDGGQHNESPTDAIRDQRLIADGFRVLRFWNNDVLGNLEGVLATIQSELTLLTSPRSLRGEVEIRAKREFRVRGKAQRASRIPRSRIDVPLTPTLSPRSAGRGSRAVTPS